MTLTWQQRSSFVRLSMRSHSGCQETSGSSPTVVLTATNIRSSPIVTISLRHLPLSWAVDTHSSWPRLISMTSLISISTRAFLRRCNSVLALSVSTRTAKAVHSLRPAGSHLLADHGMNTSCIRLRRWSRPSATTQDLQVWCGPTAGSLRSMRLAPIRRHRHLKISDMPSLKTRSMLFPRRAGLTLKPHLMTAPLTSRPTPSCTDGHLSQKPPGPRSDLPMAGAHLARVTTPHCSLTFSRASTWVRLFR